MPSEISDLAVVVVAGLTPIIALTLRAILAKMNQATKTAEETNDAVNRRHERATEDGSTPPKLYDLALSNSAQLAELTKWRKGYEGSQFPDAEAIAGFTTEVHDRLDGHSAAIKAQHELLEELREALAQNQMTEETIANALAEGIKIARHEICECEESPHEADPRGPTGSDHASRDGAATDSPEEQDAEQKGGPEAV